MDEVEETLPGWYRQQSDPTMLRWWDGSDWTEDVLPAPEEVGGESGEEPDRPPGEPTDAPPVPIGPPKDRASSPADDTGAGPAPHADEGTRRRQRPAPRSPMPRTPPSRTPPSARPGKVGSRLPVARGAWQPSRSTRGRHARRSHTQQLARVAVRALLVALVAGFGYVLARPFLDGGGSANTLSSHPRPTTTTTLAEAAGALAGEDGTPEGPDPAPLSAALPTLADLPSGWGVQADFLQQRIGFCGGRDPLSVLVPTEELRTSYSEATTGPFVFDLTARYDTSAQARQLVDLVAETAEACRHYDEGGVQATLSPLEFPRIADQTFAAHIAGTTAQGPFEGDVVWFRRGDRVVSISSLAFGKIDVGLVEVLAELIARRL